jgi:hypothetical protein
MLPSELEQGSEAWRAIRAGKVTGSRINDVLTQARKKGDVSKVRQGYMFELIAERLTGIPEEQYSGFWPDHGKEFEPLAAAAYEVLFDQVLQKVGFIVHPTMPFAGCSPDRLLGDRGIVGIKCPKTTTHLRWRQKNSCPEEHVAQLYWELCCTGREWADFVSYDPRLPEPLQLFAVRVFPEKALMTEMENQVKAFEDEIKESIKAINAVAGIREVA